MNLRVGIGVLAWGALIGFGGEAWAVEGSLSASVRATPNCAADVSLATVPLEGLLNEAIPDYLCDTSPDGCLAVTNPELRADKPRPVRAVFRTVATSASGIPTEYVEEDVLTHDSLGRLTSYNGRQYDSSFSYDYCGRLVARNHRYTAEAWRYDQESGRLLEHSLYVEPSFDPSILQVTTFAWSAEGSLQSSVVKTTYGNGQPEWKVRRHEVDDRGRIVRTTDDSGEVIEQRSYDDSAQPRMTVVSGDTEKVYAQGRLTKWTIRYPNGKNYVERRTLLADGRIARIDVDEVNSGRPYAREFVWGADGRLLQDRFIRGETRVAEYEYDDAGVLRRILSYREGAAGAAQPWVEFQY